MRHGGYMILLAAVLATALAAPAAAETPYERAQRNYAALMRGEKSVRDLSPAERRELAALEILSRRQAAPEPGTARQRCIDEEVERAGGDPSDLEMRVIDLKCSQR